MKIGAALVKPSVLSLGYWIEGKSLASGGSVFVLGRRPGRNPSANSEHLRKRMAGKNYIVTQTGESQEIWSQDRGFYLNSFWHGKTNCEVLTLHPWDAVYWCFSVPWEDGGFYQLDVVEVRELLAQVGALSHNWRRRYGSSLSSLCSFATCLGRVIWPGGHMLLSCYYLYRAERTKDPFSFPPTNSVASFAVWHIPGFPALLILCSQGFKSPSAWGDS